MQIVNVTTYIDRGLLRKRIEWVDGDEKGVADTHCAVTGVPLGPNYTYCVKHCRQFGHYSNALCARIQDLTTGAISQSQLVAFIRLADRFPDTMLDEDEWA
jgi:hypothetical protein